MNIELRDANEAVLGRGYLYREIFHSISSGDILKLENDVFDIRGTFVVIAKMFCFGKKMMKCAPSNIVATETYILYVHQLETDP